MEECTMIIEWYNNTDDSKKLNKSPTLIESGTCNIYGACNMDNPNFIVDSVKGNYVKFDNNYYFVDSRSYAGGKWIIHCSIDDLYSNRDEINSLECLIVRNETDKNNYIIDNSLPVNSYRVTSSYPVGREVISPTETTYIIGVI